MKKILFTLVYPFWFFLGRTWLGNMTMFFIVLFTLPLILSVLFPDLLETTGEDAEGIGIGVGILSFMCSPFVAMFFTKIEGFLAEHYREWNYRMEMGYKY